MVGAVRVSEIPVKRILIYDDTQEAWDEMGLSHFWAAGGIVRDFDHVIPASSWQHAIRQLRDLNLEGVRVKIEVWGHGQSGRPWIGDQYLTHFLLYELSGVLRGIHTAGSWLWFRACDTFRDEAGQKFAQRVANTLQIIVYGHTRVISQAAGGARGRFRGLLDAFGIALGFFWQSGGYGLRPGEQPHWPASEGGWSAPWKRHTVTVLARNPGRGWLQPKAA